MASSQDKKANTLRNVEVSMARAQEIMLFCLKEIFNAMDEDELEWESEQAAKPENQRLPLTACPYPRANERSQGLPPLMLWGPPGVGKSSIVLAVAEELGIDVVDVRLAQKDPSDMRGIPVPNVENGYVEWFLSSEWPRHPNSRGIIFFDELTAADKSLQAAAYELILDRKLGDVGKGKSGYKVPAGWFICAAGNEKGQKAVAGSMSSALANRFLHFRTKLEAFEWCEWGILNGLHPAVYSFISDKNAILMETPNTIPQSTTANMRLHNMSVDLEKGWPSPRSWTRVSETLYLFESYQDAVRKDIASGLASQNIFDDDAFQDMIIGLIGRQTGTPFLAWYKLLIGTSTAPNPSQFSRLMLSEALKNNSLQTFTNLMSETKKASNKKIFVGDFKPSDVSDQQQVASCGTGNFLVCTICSEFVNQTEILSQKGYDASSSKGWTFAIEENLQQSKTKAMLNLGFNIAEKLIGYEGDYFADANKRSSYGAKVDYGVDLGRRLRMIMERVFLNLENDKIKAARRTRNMEIKQARQKGQIPPDVLSPSEIFDIQDAVLDQFDKYMNDLYGFTDWKKALTTKGGIYTTLIENPASKHSKIKNLREIENLVYNRHNTTSKSTVSRSRRNPQDDYYENTDHYEDSRYARYSDEHQDDDYYDRDRDVDVYSYSRENPRVRSTNHHSSSKTFKSSVKKER